MFNAAQGAMNAINMCIIDTQVQFQTAIQDGSYFYIVSGYKQFFCDFAAALKSLSVIFCLTFNLRHHFLYRMLIWNFRV
jgi:hypothetical protein